jgi:membrane protease YdiL (CAAX protease family)
MSNGSTGHPGFESSPTGSESTNGNRLVASPWHTVLVVSALSVNAYFGWLRASALRQAANVHRPAVYGRTMIVEWLLLALVLTGVWLHRSPLSTVLGDRWRSARQALKDLGIAIAFLCVSVLVVSILGPHSHSAGTDPAVRFLMPQTANEKCLWVLLALSAGICEEAIYRGYLQHQFSAIARNIPVGIFLSAALFGVSHAYQGLRPALLIGFGGLMAGTLAWWRRSVRPGMIAHTLQDMLALVVAH